MDVLPGKVTTFSTKASTYGITWYSLCSLLQAQLKLHSNISKISHNLLPRLIVGRFGNAWSRGAPSFASNSSYTGQAFRRRNVVRFRHGGAKEDLPDRRFVVRELLCTQMGFVPTDILAVINLPDRQGYDVSFKLMSDLDRFWANLTRLRDTEGWDKFSFIPISRPDTASVTIVFWNEAVPPQDIVIWLRRHCDLMSDLSKNRDEDGVWTGGWRVLVKLRQQNNITQHLPNSFFIGREKGICFYAGQPRRCFKCGKAGHVASVCSMVKCSLCNEMGHVSATCQNIRCNLCGRIGHPHRDCPDAWHNICKDSPDEDLLAAADDIQEEEEALLSGSVVTEAEPQPHTGDTTQDQAESGPIETTMEVVEQVVQPSVVVSSPARSSNNNKRRKKDKASRKPEGEWTTVEKPTKMRERVKSIGSVRYLGDERCGRHIPEASQPWEDLLESILYCLLRFLKFVDQGKREEDDGRRKHFSLMNYITQLARITGTTDL
ncbi:uncharacterized protein RB166_014946 [Leptodactylus fuscus]